MAAEHTSPEFLASRSELVVSEPSWRVDVLGILQNLLKRAADSHPLLVTGSAVEAAFDEATTILDLEIEGTSFVRADRVSRNLIRSLGERISDHFSAGQSAASPTVQQMSQTIVPA